MGHGHYRWYCRSKFCPLHSYDPLKLWWEICPSFLSIQTTKLLSKPNSTGPIMTLPSWQKILLLRSIIPDSQLYNFRHSDMESTVCRKEIKAKVYMLFHSLKELFILQGNLIDFLSISIVPNIILVMRLTNTQTNRSLSLVANDWFTWKSMNFHVVKTQYFW